MKSADTLNQKFISLLKKTFFSILLFLCLFSAAATFALAQENKISGRITKISEDQSASIRETVNLYSSLANKGDFIGIEKVISEFTNAMVADNNRLNKIAKQEKSEMDDSINLFRPPLEIKYDYDFVKSNIPALIKKNNLSVDEIKLIRSENSQARICVRLNNTKYSNAKVVSDFYLIENEYKKWKIYYVILHLSVTTCERQS